MLYQIKFLLYSLKYSFTTTATVHQIFAYKAIELHYNRFNARINVLVQYIQWIAKLNTLHSAVKLYIDIYLTHVKNYDFDDKNKQKNIPSTTTVSNSPKPKFHVPYFYSSKLIADSSEFTTMTLYHIFYHT